MHGLRIIITIIRNEAIRSQTTLIVIQGSKLAVINNNKIRSRVKCKFTTFLIGPAEYNYNSYGLKSVVRGGVPRGGGVI